MTTTLEPLQTVRAGVLEVAHCQADAGLRVIVPYPGGPGSTRFLDPATPRSGQQADLGAGVIDLLDALDLRRAILAGYDWGGCAACVAARGGLPPTSRSYPPYDQTEQRPIAVPTITLAGHTSPGSPRRVRQRDPELADLRAPSEGVRR